MPRKLLVAMAVLFVILAVLLAIAARLILDGDAVRATLEQQASAALGQPVAIETASPRIFPRPAIHLTGVSIGAGKQVTIERASLATGLRALLSRRIENAVLSVEGSRIDVRWALALFELLSTDQPAATTAGSSGGVSIVSVTALNLRRMDLVAAGRTLRVDMDSSLTSSDRLAVTRFDAKSETSDLRATGEFNSLSGRTGNFTVDAAALDIDGLLAFLAATMPAGSQTASSRARAPSAPLKLTIVIKARKGIAAGAAFSNLNATCRVDGDNARLDDLRLNAFDGGFKGVVGLQGSGAQPQFSWRGTFDGLDAAKVAAFAGTTGSVTGTLAGNVDIAASGYDPAAALRGAHGRARVVLSDGRLPGLEVVRAVILAFGKPTGDRPAGSGEAFSQLAATMAVGDQRLTTSDLTFASRDLDMTAKGTLSLASQALNFQADLILSRELSAQAGRDLYRLAREDGRIILPARITGTVGAPTVFIDILEALKRALRNRAEDELKSLFDRFRKKVIRD